MATPKARTKAIIDALLDQDVADAKITKAVEGVISGRVAAPLSEMTEGQKARAFLKILLEFVKDNMVLKRERDLTRDAANAARGEIDNEFTPPADPAEPPVNPTPLAGAKSAVAAPVPGQPSLAVSEPVTPATTTPGNSGNNKK